MEKKIWVTPSANVEWFMPNEYVMRACWGIGCERYSVTEEFHDKNIVGADPFHDHYSMNYCDSYNNNHHQHANGTGCGYSTNQYVQDLGDNNFSIIETNLSKEFTDEGIYQLPTTIWGVTDSNTYDKTVFENGTGSSFIHLTNEQMHTGVRLYWTTVGDWGRWDTVFHHSGIVKLLDALKVNHS